jgi:hypothetical protein
LGRGCGVLFWANLEEVNIIAASNLLACSEVREEIRCWFSDNAVTYVSRSVV